MAEPGGNRRGRRSKEEILDATARVMALRGYAATTISTITAETGLPRSAIYHHFHSKGGLLSAVMARGARDFFAAMRTAHRDPPEGGSHRERMAWYLDRTAEVLAAQPDFMRLHFLLLLSDEATEAEVAEMNRRVRDEARAHIRAMISAVFTDQGPETARAVAEELDHFTLAGFDGAFLTSQADPERTVATQTARLADALVALGEATAVHHKGLSRQPS
ncbi:TetR family transcriptional regulator [Kitasatospora sp. SolWspMP-SS2h]|uniref:TetR/AcrR family transcriptional regulator n=1 Tax=Kitasatospora sp. SolWspMP-SS2h TaxID=1305729 RepID=UPI000DBFD28D|nr:TetR/AcrR family transcriptional regulator [Kitasatospora sp. SolWspMP-SS2h]RAJ44653.1 TetR family transcriptional regulator [Kitasatospora sp. SolWspMP-SS2h]